MATIFPHSLLSLDSCLSLYPLAQAPSLADRISSMAESVQQVFGVTPGPSATPSRATSANDAFPETTRARSASATRARTATRLELGDVVSEQGFATPGTQSSQALATPRRGGRPSAFERDTTERAVGLAKHMRARSIDVERAYPSNGAESTRRIAPQAPKTHNLTKEGLMAVSVNELSARKQSRELRHIGLRTESPSVSQYTKGDAYQV